MKFNQKGELILSLEEERRYEYLRENYDEAELLSLVLLKKVV
jgi:hypothetical protein